MAVGRHLPVGRFFRWPCGGTTEGAGRAGQLLNALGLWKEALREGHLGPEVHGEPHLGFFAWDGKSPLGNLIDLENSYWNPREVTFGGLSPLAWGKSSFSRQGFQTEPRQITRIHLLQSGSGAEREDSTWPGDSKSRTPPPPPNSEHSPVCLAKDKCWLVGADSHFTGVVLIAEVLNELRKHKQMMRDIHPCT